MPYFIILRISLKVVLDCFETHTHIVNQFRKKSEQTERIKEISQILSIGKCILFALEP